ncbi:hypothetical protein MSG28_009711 [Choristoneura fumiferana]|uniref:Uncharacterized protein n=1 Tax=Choristoneura fumiferana TaxID=7141 RepID=A0ACC0JCF6_CHOFU|nr:hypothetical protein MSG28_009711 [Choristoneura fumiferana]
MVKRFRRCRIYSNYRELLKPFNYSTIIELFCPSRWWTSYAALADPRCPLENLSAPTTICPPCYMAVSGTATYEVRVLHFVHCHFNELIRLAWLGLDDLIKVAGSRSMQAASNRGNWRSMGEAYVQKWTSYG